jgi:N utilization substance protein A
MKIDLHVLEQLEKEKGVSLSAMISALESALLASYKKYYPSKNVTLKIVPDSGLLEIVVKKTVVDKVNNIFDEISLTQAREIYPDVNIGDTIEVQVDPKNFGRIAALTAKQVWQQKIKEAERNAVYEEFKDRVFGVISGKILRQEGKNWIVQLGRGEGILPQKETVYQDRYAINERYVFYVLSVKKLKKDVEIVLSRSHPNLVKRLFELESAEIRSGVVEIVSIARDPGSRTKIAVLSRDAYVDPLGVCLGLRNSRIQNVTRELRGEKIDVILYNPEPKIYIASALAPAKVKRVEILDQAKKESRVYVDKSQLSLAIGKDAQNVRLAHKLTGYKIDIKIEE